MLELFGLAVVVVIPPALVALLLVYSNHVQRAGAVVVARQVAVTDAIHRELGAVVAPVMRRSRGSWELRMAVPLERPNLVGSVLAVAHRALAHTASAARERVRIVLVPRA
jgi:hypothetical protein